MRAAGLLLVVCIAGLGPGMLHARAGQQEAVLLESDTGRRIDPLGPGEDVRVFVFVRRDCPIANRYAPEIARLHDAFPSGQSSSVRLWLVYVDPADSSAAIAAHQREYHLDAPWLRDPVHALAARAGATVTPEAAVYSAWRPGGRQRLYVGRIDDRVMDIGRVRPAATTHELKDAIDAALAGRMPRPAGGPAVGCFIADAR